ncbi:MAG: GntR family transcriptional regulator [Ginsengibacter sp.]
MIKQLSRIKPIETLSQVDRIEKALEEYLKNEKLSPGDPLPKEMELAKAMGVSRTALREAISRFKNLGIIESRKNRGMIVVQPDLLNNMERIFDSQLLNSTTMKEIFELRLVIELGLPDFVFLNKTEAGILKLEEIVEREENSSDKIIKLKCDIEFHSTLYSLSGNETIIRFQKILLPVFGYVDNSIPSNASGEGATTVSHRQLLNILINGTPEEFRLAMRNHLSSYFKKIESY